MHPKQAELYLLPLWHKKGQNVPMLEQLSYSLRLAHKPRDGWVLRAFRTEDLGSNEKGKLPPPTGKHAGLW